MSTLDWLKDYDSDLFSQVTAVMGDQPSPYYDDELISKLKQVGVTGFYFNSVHGDSELAPDWLPKSDRLGVLILKGTATRTSANFISQMYETALNSVAKGGKMHTILYFKDAKIEFQSLFSLGNLNKHASMGAQAIVGSPTTGFLKAVTEFVSRYAGRDDIFQFDKGEWENGLKAIEQHVREKSVVN